MPDMPAFSGMSESIQNRLRKKSYLNQIEQIRRQKNNYERGLQELSEFAADDTNCYVEFQVNGAGESLVTIDFKNTAYSEQPILMGFGGFVRDWNETTENNIIGRGQYPTISVVVVGYVVEDTPPLKRIYKGAKLAVVTGGNTFQKLIVNCCFTGKSLVGPATNISSITTTNSGWYTYNSERNNSEMIYNSQGDYI